MAAVPIPAAIDIRPAAIGTYGCVFWEPQPLVPMAAGFCPAAIDIVVFCKILVPMAAV